MENNIRGKINVKGGILSIGDLESVIQISKSYGIKNLYVGERENINFIAHGRTREDLINLFESKGYEIEIDEEKYPNIVSSYPAEDIFSSNTWLSEGIYQDVLNSISFRPQLKINIADSNQGLIPLFSGNLNFVSSSQINFWFLYIKHSSFKGLQRWPVLIYSTEIGRLAKLLDDELTTAQSVDINKTVEKVSKSHRFIVADILEEPAITKSVFPNYEGLNRIGDKYWLGIYRRDNSFPIEFLQSVCALCLESKIGTICLTTWNTIIIKGISEHNKQEWEKLLGSSGINMRHSSLELNWQLPDFDRTALNLKNFLVNIFDKFDIQTYGLGFTIKTKPMEVAGSIVIERKGRIRIGKLSLLPLYTILYAENFSPNAQEYHVYSVDIGKSELPVHLMQLCRNYYQQLGKAEARVINVKQEVETERERELIHQCIDCLSIYIEKYGDEMNNIPANTPFSALPESYCCPVCEGSKARYIERSLIKVA